MGWTVEEFGSIPGGSMEVPFSAKCSDRETHSILVEGFLGYLAPRVKRPGPGVDDPLPSPRSKKV
jgi:hypothetical protein